MHRNLHPVLLLWVGAVLLLKVSADAKVIINENPYNPVELPSFDATGNPVLQDTATGADFTDDVHEFVELHNPTAPPLSIAGWRLEGGVEFTFSAGTMISAGGWLVVAKNAARIQTVYGISGVLGPFANGSKLNNKGDVLRLVTPTNTVSDSVSYQANFPCPISASKLGAGDDYAAEFGKLSVQRAFAPAVSAVATRTPGQFRVRSSRCPVAPAPSTTSTCSPTPRGRSLPISLRPMCRRGPITLRPRSARIPSASTASSPRG